MPLLHTLGVVVSFWFALFVVDRTMRRHRPCKSTYQQNLDEWGVSVSFAHVRFYTTRFNRLFHSIGNYNKPACRFWFGLGAFIGVALMLTSMVVLSFTLYQTLFARVSDSSQPVLTPIMPGVNLPWNDIAYYLLTLVICTVFHEVGHALAASTEQVRVNGFGVFMLFLYPGAFVDLHSDHLSVISPRRQLRIYCAGVWHNVILVLCALLLVWSLPLSLAPFYTTGIGTVVTSVPRDSVLTGKLNPGGVITSMNSCPVYGSGEWYSCIEKVGSSPQPGYCVSLDLLERHLSYPINQTTLAEDGTRECCDKDSQSDICFHVMYGKGRPSTFKCLTARAVSSRETCFNPRDCKGVADYACVYPAISSATRLVRISHTEGKDVLFLGDPRGLPYAVSITSYLPNSPYCPLWLPDLLQTLCMYIASLSSALALLNMVPAYFLDGQWALTVLIELCFEGVIPNPKHRRQICNCILICGSILLGLNICLAIWTLINW